MSTDPKTVAAAIRRIATVVDRDERPSKSTVITDLKRVLASMDRKAGMPINLCVAGTVEIGGIDVHYSLTTVEKMPSEEIARFQVEFVLGSDLERRIASGAVGDDLLSVRLDSYRFRGVELAHTGEPGYIVGDDEIVRFGRFPNVLTKCMRDAMLTMGLSTLVGVHVTGVLLVP